MTAASRLLRRMVSSSSRDLRSRGLWRACLAECVGSLLLVFFCCAPNIDFPISPDGSECFSVDAKVLRAGFTSGLIVACVVWSLGHISGAHINPALTLGFFVSGNVSLIRTLLYIPMQCTGGVAGALLLKLLTPFQLHNVTSFGINSFNPTLTHPAQAFGMELVLTFAMVLPVIACTDRLRFDQTGSMSLAAGLQVSCCIFAGAVLSGSSMNPIRTLGPAVASGRYDQLWVYIAGPSCGGGLSGICYALLFKGSFMLTGDEKSTEKGNDAQGSPCQICQCEANGSVEAGPADKNKDNDDDGTDPETASQTKKGSSLAKTGEKRWRQRMTTTDTSMTEL
ncbi:hypothetical protein BOX15_Mlig008233g1 [Macrostomum lignano]|uniref:Aquaporin n=2 Tax=Macrostomum lignano TaxID=282301 RepID=A0A1I8GPN9_9PLAT|nr:hypothetical protein BOX15_Mlig008233g1 [Macrostomum lignano]